MFKKIKEFLLGRDKFVEPENPEPRAPIPPQRLYRKVEETKRASPPVRSYTSRQSSDSSSYEDSRRSSDSLLTLGAFGMFSSDSSSSSSCFDSSSYSSDCGSSDSGGCSCD